MRRYRQYLFCLVCRQWFQSRLRFHQNTSLALAQRHIGRLDDIHAFWLIVGSLKMQLALNPCCFVQRRISPRNYFRHSTTPNNRHTCNRLQNSAAPTVMGRGGGGEGAQLATTPKVHAGVWDATQCFIYLSSFTE